MFDVRYGGVMLFSTCVLICRLHAAAMWRGDPSPYDDAHLVVIRSQDLDIGGGWRTIKSEHGALFGRAARFEQGLSHVFIVKHPGEYKLWLRVRAGQGMPVRVDLRCGGTSMLNATVNDGAGSVDRGGPNGYAGYRNIAEKRAGKREPAALGAGPSLVLEPSVGQFGAGLNELANELSGDSKDKWIHSGRIERAEPQSPYYWWHAGSAVLARGACELRLSGKGAFDCALLTTSSDVAYPFGGDIAAPRASYIRFHIEQMPEEGVTISGRLRIHRAPWSVRAQFTPAELGEKPVPHKAVGFTRWYCLQQLEHVPAFGAAGMHLSLSIDTRAKGVTQFAVFPHQDAVVREIDWREPEGTRISMATDFEHHLHKLRTFRDHARENYERAVNCAGGSLYPLTRGPLYFGNAWGCADGIPGDYMVKTLRLLGFNCAGIVGDPVGHRRRYGWASHSGQYWPPTFMPFDEQDAAAKYQAHYKHKFAANSDLMEGVTIYQVCDEPGEIARAEMTGPLWRYEAGDGGAGPRWVDLAGGSELHTRLTNYHDCVLEGQVMRYGYWFGFRVATDSAETPRAFGSWRVGTLQRELPQNVAVGRNGEGESRLIRPGATIKKAPTSFKIIYEDGTATLWLNGNLVSRMAGLRKQGGFGFFGPAKGIAALSIRPIRKEEAQVPVTGDVSMAGDDGADDVLGDLLEDLKDDPVPEWARPKSLDRFVRADWVVGGGMPRAHAGFRRWAKEQGLVPGLFGKTTWGQVGMLTMPGLIESDDDRRLYYWSRRYASYLTPRMFSLAADAIRGAAPNKSMLGFVALSGHSLYMGGALPLDMFQLGACGGALVPGISDWMSMGSWRWDSHQAVAYSVAPYNAGARVYGGEPVSYPMMHCVWPSEFRAYTMLANNVKYISYYNYGPSYMVTEGFWSEARASYRAAHITNNRAAQVDDVLARARMRRSRVAMLYAMSNEYWNPASSFADKRAAFLGLSHEYFQPELITEDNVAAGALQHYDALYVLDPVVAGAAQDRIGEWVKSGGLLWTCADAMSRNEFNRNEDLLLAFGLTRRLAERAGLNPGLVPGAGETRIRAQTTRGTGMDAEWPDARVRAHYGDGRPAWLEKAVGKGRVVYHAYRCGLNYTAKAERIGGRPVVWADTGREQLVLPLKEAGVTRELTLSQPAIMASPMTSETGTVIVLYNMRAAPVTNLVIRLMADEPPVAVQAFEDLTLVDLQYKYTAGSVSIELPVFDGSQMIVVRSRRASPDQRVEQMKRNTARLLGSMDWQDLSAAAWFIGFYPNWDMADRLVPLLRHENGCVRRAAAESVGRLRYLPAAGMLVEVSAVERDAHALGDQVYALAQLQDARFPELALTAAEHPKAFVRRQAVRAGTLFLEHKRDSGDVPEQLKRLGLSLHQAARNDVDRRVSSLAAPLLRILNPGR